MLQNLSVIGTIEEIQRKQVLTFTQGDHTMVILPNYVGKAEEAGRKLEAGSLVEFSGEAVAADVSKKGTPYIKMNVRYVRALAPSSEGGVGRAEITLLGYLGDDPTLRYTSNESPVANFSMATGRDQPTWFRVATWGRQGENVKKYLDKGSRVMVVGRLNVPTPYTGNDGQARVNLEVTARNVQFLSFKQQQAPQAEKKQEAEEVGW